MNLATAASIGLGVIRHREEIGAALGGLGAVAKFGGQGIAKLADRFQGELSKALYGLSDDGPQAGRGINTLHAIGGLAYFDADQNGQVSRQELSQGLQHLQETGLAGQHPRFQQLNQLGTAMLQNYERMAQLDGNSDGISYRDLGTLARLDRNLGMVSPTDWEKLNA